MAFRLPEPKKNKYGNKKVEYDGHTFDSIAERDRYLDLKLLEKAGLISSLRLQVKYELIKAAEADGVKFPSYSYIADFVYKDKAGQTVIEDVKGMRTPVYKLKRALMYDKYGYVVQEINYNEKGAVSYESCAAKRKPGK